MRILVAGATGTVGSAIAEALRDQELLLPTRSEARAKELRARFPGSAIFVGPYAEPGNEAFRSWLSARAPLDAVVASLGAWWSGKLLREVDDETWQAVLDMRLGTHFRLARACLPFLREGGRYVFIAGFHAEEPLPRAGLISIAGAGQVMMARVLQKEEPGIRFLTLILGSVSGGKVPREAVGRAVRRLLEMPDPPGVWRLLGPEDLP